MGRLRYVRLSARGRVLVWVGAAAAVLIIVCCTAVLHMKPIVSNLATARVSNSVNQIVVAAVNDAVEQGKINYDALIVIDKDENGKVSALKSNMAEFNRLQGIIADDILQRMAEVSTSELAIPVGTLTGSSLLAGRGPLIRVRMQSVGSAAASFRNAFTAAGINQTKHQVLLNVEVSVTILLPGFITSTKIENEISVAETVIVGSVPETYTYFSTAENELDDYAQEYILNKG